MGAIVDFWVMFFGFIAVGLLIVMPILLPIAWGIDIWTRLKK